MHWFVVVSQKEARIFTKYIDENKLALLKTVSNPLGSVKKRSLIRKEAGHGVKSLGHAGAVHYSEPKRHDPHEQAVIQFAKQVSKFLETEKLKKHFNSLTVVAEPHLIGLIRKAMTNDVKDVVIEWIKKDLQKTPQNKLIDFLIGTERNTSPDEQASFFR